MMDQKHSKKMLVGAEIPRKLSVMARLDSLYKLANRSLRSHAADCDREKLFNCLFKDVEFSKEDKETKFIKLHTFNWERKEPYMSFLYGVVKGSGEQQIKCEAVKRIIELLGDEAPTRLKEAVRENPLIEQISCLKKPMLIASHMVAGQELRDRLFKALFEDVDFFRADPASKFTIVYNLFSGHRYSYELGLLEEERYKKSKEGCPKHMLEEIDNKIGEVRKKHSKEIVLLKRIVEEAGYQIRYIALKKLIEYRNLDREIIPFYTGLLSSENEGIRHYAALALGEQRDISAVREIAGDALFRSLNDENKFVRYRVLWTIGKLRLSDNPSERRSGVSQLFDLLSREKDKIVANRALITLNKIFLRLPTSDIIVSLSKEFFKNPVGVSLFAIKHISKRIFPNYGPEIETDKIKSLQSSQFESYLKNNKVMTKLLLEWGALDDGVRKYHLLKATEEFFSMLTRAFVENESMGLKECLGGYLNNLEDDILGILFSALRDKEDFVRYRSAGVLYRIIKMIAKVKGLDLSERSNMLVDKVIKEGSEKGDLPKISDVKGKMKSAIYILGQHTRAANVLNGKTGVECQKMEESIDFLYAGILEDIFLPLKEAYDVEKVDSVKRKIKESLDLCVFSTQGLTPSDY